MKAIHLRTDGELKTLDVIQVVARQPGTERGIDYENMRKRVRLLDAVSALPAGAQILLLEDADYAFLATLVKSFTYATAAPELFAIINSILEAKSPPAVMVPSGKKHASGA